MLLRVYAPDTDQVKKDYAGTSVKESWHNFQNFARWFYEQPFAGLPGYELDKDLKSPGNRIYCDEHCSIIPKELNAFISADRRSNKHGVGVGYVKLTGKFFASISLRGEKRYLGTYETPDEASEAYRKARPQIANELADILLLEGKITVEQANLVKTNYGVVQCP